MSGAVWWDCFPLDWDRWSGASHFSFLLAEKKRNQCGWRASSNFELELIKLVIVNTYKRLITT